MSGAPQKMCLEFHLGTPLYEIVNEVLRLVVDAQGGDRKAAARSLQISEPTIIRRLGSAAPIVNHQSVPQSARDQQLVPQSGSNSEAAGKD